MIFISAGHTSDKPGACNGDTCEYDFTSLWQDRLVDILSEHYDTVAVPEGSLREKVEFINKHDDAYAAIEIHFNANMDNASGSETLYYPESESGKELAQHIQDQFSNREVFQPDRGVKEGYYYKNGKRTDKPLYFLRKTKAPAVIVEPEFMSQLDSIQDGYYMGCDAIAQAIIEFCDHHHPLY